MITRKIPDEICLSALLDAGHGGADPGCAWEDPETKKVILEKDINLVVAEQVIEFVPPYVRTHLSRRKDKFVNLKDRAVTTYHYDLLVSIHCNAIAGDEEKQKEVFGTEVYVRSMKDELSVHIAGMFLKAVSKALGIEPNMPNPIRSNPKLRVLQWADKRLDRHGRSVSCLCPAPSNKGWGAKDKGCPAVLIELGYLTNAGDRKALTDQKKQRAAAKAIARVITMLSPKPGPL